MDPERIQELLRLMETHGLAEIEVQDADTKVRLKKGVVPEVHAAPGPVVAAGGAPAVPGALEDTTGLHTITSPIVGTFYTASGTDAEPFVEVGDPVEPDTVVCIVEAMKVMNEVKAEVPGTIEKLLVENGRPVEFGQPLFRVATR